MGTQAFPQQLSDMQDYHPADGVYSSDSMLNGRFTTRRPHDLPSYSGDDRDFAVTWFRAWCSVVEGEGVPIDYAVRNWMTQSLTGKALLWHKFNLAHGQHIDVSSADSFKEQLMKHFAPFYKDTLLRNWWDCKQEEEELLTDFISRASIYISELFPNYQEEEKVAMVFKKVNRHFKVALSSMVVKSMAQLMMIGRTMQNNITECDNQRHAAPTMVYAEPSLAYSRSEDCRKEHPPAPLHWQEDIPHSQSQSPLHSSSGSNTALPKVTQSSTGATGAPLQRQLITCNYCGKEDHVAADCRQRLLEEDEAVAAQQAPKNE
jgi:hypothetical protein